VRVRVRVCGFDAIGVRTCSSSVSRHSFLEHNDRPVLYFKSSGLVSITRFNIHQFYVLPTQCIYMFLCESENKQWLFPYTALTDWFL
jgi:hypothetical protein